MDKVPALTIYNMPPSPPNWDSVGVFYVTFCAVWTTLVFSGMAFCLANRHNPILRLRGIPLSFSAIAFLHCYWVLGQIVYPIGATVPTVLAYDIQYFFMGIWFPLGIALFQASNTRFLHIAKLQKQFTSPHLRAGMGCNGSHSSWLCRLRNMNYTKRIMIFIGFGMIFQVNICLLIILCTMLTIVRFFLLLVCGWPAASIILRLVFLAPRSVGRRCLSS